MKHTIPPSQFRKYASTKRPMMAMAPANASASELFSGGVFGHPLINTARWLSLRKLESRIAWRAPCTICKLKQNYRRTENKLFYTYFTLWRYLAVIDAFMFAWLLLYTHDTTRTCALTTKKGNKERRLGRLLFPVVAETTAAHAVYIIF